MDIKREVENYLDMFQFLYEGTEDYFFIWDVGGDRIYFAGSPHEKYPLTLYGREGNTLEECRNLVYVRDRENVEKQFDMFRRGEIKACNMECRLLNKENKKVWVNCRAKCRTCEGKAPELVIGRISVNMLRNKMDRMTGLLNENKFMEDMQNCRAQARAGYMLLMGIDNLKHINMKYGRSYGNYVLKKVSELIEEQLEDSTRLYRLDGDRFGMMLPDADKNMVKALFRKLQAVLQEYCTISAGSAYCSPECGVDCSMIYQYAECALDHAKENGKNKLEFFSPEHYNRRLESINLLEELRADMVNDFRGFKLYYQPLVNGEDGSIWGAEALLRYDSPSRGMVMPKEFIHLLEKTRLIIPIGEWVLKTALNQCRKWREILPDFHINVNISYIQLQDKNICQKVLDILEKSNVDGEALTLEVTESVQLQDYPYFNRVFSQWKKAGIKIAIDDFGTGYSSLSYLKSIEVDEIKIDKCFVSNIQNNAYNYRLLKNVIDLADTADIKVCCEGVETEEELEVLKEFGLELLQGYLFAKACDADTFEKKCIHDYPNVRE